MRLTDVKKKLTHFLTAEIGGFRRRPRIAQSGDFCSGIEAIPVILHGSICARAIDFSP